MTGGKSSTKNSEQVNVVVRCRPMTQSEKTRTKKVITCNSKTKELFVQTGNAGPGQMGQPHQTKTYNFDKVFGERSTQMDIYNAVVAGQLDDVLSGYNCTVLAYGQTGTGKTYTMEGEQSGENYKWDEDPKSGIIPRALSHLFDRLNQMDCEFGVRISLLEIYNEEIYDLLSTSNDLPKLRLFEDASRKGSVVVSNLTEVHIREKSQIYEILQQGSQKRRTAATNMNEFSSRSHSVFSVTVHTKDTTQNNMEKEELVKIGKLNLVDLAGSENIGRSGAVDKRAREAGNINTSLLTLGRCITALVDKAPHVPYRESKLTRLLQDSLGGSTKTSIIATISPGQNNIEETLSTLDYAFRSKSIHNRPKVNQKLTKKALIHELEREIGRLHDEVKAQREKNGVFLPIAQYEEMKLKIETFEASVTCREKELENYKELFQLKENELESTQLELSSTMKELKSQKEKLTILAQQKKALTEYGEKLFSQASQLEETVTVVRDDLNLVHNKVDRVEQVNELNIQQVQQILSSVNEDVSNISNNSSTSMENIGNKINVNLDGYDNLKNLDVEAKKEVELLLGRLNQVLNNVQDVKKSSLKMNEKRIRNTKNLQEKTQQIRSSIEEMQLGETISSDIKTFNSDVCDILEENKNVVENSRDTINEIRSKHMKYNEGVMEFTQTNRKWHDQLSTNYEKHQEAEVSLKADEEEAELNILTTIRKELNIRNKNMMNRWKEHENAVMTHLKKMRDEVTTDIEKGDEWMSRIESQIHDNMRMRHDKFDDKKREIYKENNEMLDDMINVVSKVEDNCTSVNVNIQNICEKFHTDVDLQYQQIDTAANEVELKCSKLQLKIEEEEEKTRTNLTCHIEQLDVDTCDYNQHLCQQESLVQNQFDQIEEEMQSNVETTEKMIEKNEAIIMKVDDEKQQLVHINEDITSYISNNNDMCSQLHDNINQYRTKMIRSRPTGKTPARNTTYKLPGSLEPKPIFELDISIPNGDDVSNVAESSNSTHHTENNEEMNDISLEGNMENDTAGTNILDESLTIPDKAGKPFFQSGKNRKNKNPQSFLKGESPLRTLQSSNRMSFD